MLCYDSLESELETQSAWCPQLYWGCAINQPTRPWIILRHIHAKKLFVGFSRPRARPRPQNFGLDRSWLTPRSRGLHHGTHACSVSISFLPFSSASNLRRTQSITDFVWRMFYTILTRDYLLTAGGDTGSVPRYRLQQNTGENFSPVLWIGALSTSTVCIWK